MKLKFKLKRILDVVCWIAIILVAINIARHPYPPDGKPHSLPVLADWSFFPLSIAANSGQNYPPHLYYGEGSQCGGTGGYGSCFSGHTALSAGANDSAMLQLPENPDQPIACIEYYSADINVNSATAGDWVYAVPGGVANPQNSGCPQFPYIGSHAYGPGYTLVDGASAASTFATNASGFGSWFDQRGDRITFNGASGCGSPLNITSASFNSGTNTVTATVSGNTGGNAIAAGHYVQVFGSSASGNNSQLIGGNNEGAFPVTAASSTSISYTDGSGANCSSSCGTISWPNYQGPPPYNLLLGQDGSYPQLGLEIEVPSGASYSVSYTLWARELCISMIGCSMAGSGGCGQGANVYW